jgi:hypothetical protein
MKVECEFINECKKNNEKPECNGVCILWTEKTGFAICNTLKIKR